MDNGFEREEKSKRDFSSTRCLISSESKSDSDRDGEKQNFLIDPKFDSFQHEIEKRLMSRGERKNNFPFEFEQNSVRIEFRKQTRPRREKIRSVSSIRGSMCFGMKSNDIPTQKRYEK